MKIYYKSEAYNGPLPDVSDGICGQKIFEQGGSTIVRLSEELVVKYGTHVTTTEAASLLFVHKQVPNVPVPRIHACYTIGPFERDLADFGSSHDTYIIMDWVRGCRLDHVWEQLSEASKESLATQLHVHMHDLRSVTADRGSLIGSVDGGPIRDPILETHSTQG